MWPMSAVMRLGNFSGRDRETTTQLGDNLGSRTDAVSYGCDSAATSMMPTRKTTMAAAMRRGFQLVGGA